MMPSKTPHDAANDASALVARYVQKRLVVECAERGVASRIARELGFTTAHIANAKNYGSVGDKFARAIAAYWGMTYDQLQAVATGKASAPDVAPAVDPVASPAPPPTSDVRITDDATDAIVNDAFNPVRHKASDVPPVVEALQRTAALFRDNVDPVAYAARLLDAQAEARVKGRKVSPEELPFAALGMTERLLRISEEKNAKDTAEARAFIEREGLPALPPGEVHPEVKKAQERERRRREGR